MNHVAMRSFAVDVLLLMSMLLLDAEGTRVFPVVLLHQMPTQVRVWCKSSQAVVSCSIPSVSMSFPSNLIILQMRERDGNVQCTFWVQPFPGSQQMFEMQHKIYYTGVSHGHVAEAWWAIAFSGLYEMTRSQLHLVNDESLITAAVNLPRAMHATLITAWRPSSGIPAIAMNLQSVAFMRGNVSTYPFSASSASDDPSSLLHLISFLHEAAVSSLQAFSSPLTNHPQHSNHHATPFHGGAFWRDTPYLKYEKVNKHG